MLAKWRTEPASKRENGASPWELGLRKPEGRTLLWPYPFDPGTPPPGRGPGHAVRHSPTGHEPQLARARRPDLAGGSGEGLPRNSVSSGWSPRPVGPDSRRRSTELRWIALCDLRP